MTKRIGIFLGIEPFGGGMFQHSINVLDALCKLSQKHHFSLTAVTTSPHWNKHLAGRDISIHTVDAGIWKNKYFKRMSCVLPAFFWRRASRFFHPVCKAIEAAQCDLFFFPAQDVQTYQVSTPAIGWVHDLMHRYEGQFPEVSANGEFARRENHFRRICNYSAVVVTDSETGREQVVESYGTPHERIVPLPYLPPRYINADDKTETEKKLTGNPKQRDEEMLAPLGLPDHFFFYPAQFWEHKNHLRLIKAFALVLKKEPQAALVLAGSEKGGYAAARELTQKLGIEKQVFFTGYVPDEAMPALYRKARALIMPTFFGPTNIPPLEAMSLGCPVAVSGIYAMPEIYKDAALYFDPEKTKDIAEQMHKLWVDDDLCNTLQKRGKELTKEMSFDKFCDAIEEIIEKITGETSP